MKFSSRLAFLSLAVVVLAGATRTFAQDTPLEVSYDYPRFGGDIGLSSVWQTGTYTAGCGTFDQGAKINPIIAAAYDRPIGPSLRFEVLLGYRGASITSSYNSREAVVLKTTTGTARVNVDFENIGDARFSYIFALPSVKFYITKRFFAGAGLSAGLLLNKTTQYTKNILSKTVMVNDLGLSEVSYMQTESTDPYSKVYAEEDRSDANGIALDGVAYAGIEFRATSKLFIEPRVLFAYPLTKVLSNPDLSLNSLQFMIGARYAFKD